jgi:hypothetical protein
MVSDDSGYLLVQARDLPRGDDCVWEEHHFIWKRPESWMPQLTAWLGNRFRADGMRRLKPGTFRDLCWDDTDWSRVLERCLIADIEYHVGKLAAAIEPAILRVYHGCRTDDAGTFFREGLHVHNRDAMVAKLRAVVEAHPELHRMKSRLQEAIDEIGNTIDVGCLYVIADDKELVDRCAHYMIYGSEWIAAVLGDSRDTLKKTGAPTLIEIDLPLSMSSLATRKEFASKMLREWTRLACNQPDWSAPINFTFMLRTNIPAECVVGHSHPKELVDPLEHFTKYRAPNPECTHCRNTQP